MTSPTSARSSAVRSPALRVLDIVVGVVIGLFGLFFGLYSLALFSGLRVDPEVCGAGCDTGGLTAIVVAGIIVTVLGWALTTGLFLVRVVRRRLAFFWPLVGLVVLVVTFYATAAGVSAWTANLGAP